MGGSYVTADGDIMEVPGGRKKKRRVEENSAGQEHDALRKSAETESVGLLATEGNNSSSAR